MCYSSNVKLIHHEMEVQQNRLIQKADTVMRMRIKCGFELPDSQSRKEKLNLYLFADKILCLEIPKEYTHIHLRTKKKTCQSCRVKKINMQK